MKKLITCFACLFASLSLDAATVKQVKANKVLIELEGENAEVNQEFYLIDSQSGKKKALVVIKQIKGAKAIAEVLKGKAEAEQGLLPKLAKSTSNTEDNNDSERKTSHKGFQRNPSKSWGLIGSYLMASMSAKYVVTDVAGTTSMTGNQFALGGFYNHPLDNNLMITTLAHYESFSVSGSASGALCDSNTNPSCSVNINYLSLYGFLKYYISNNQMRPWVGAGGGLLLSMSSSSNVIKPPSMNQVISFTGGIDWQLSRKNFIPVSFEYSLYPPTSTVNANIMAIRGGYAWNF